MLNKMMGIIQVTILVLVVPLVYSLRTRDPESSEDYLKNVMVELQGLKSSQSYVDPYPHIRDNFYFTGKRLSARNPMIAVSSNALPGVIYQGDVPRVQTIGFTSKKIEPVDTDHSSSNQFYQQVPAPATFSAPLEADLSLGYLKNDLATMYKQALESGTTINLSLLKNTLESGQVPSLINNHLQFPTNQQHAYAYYFYPLKSFMNNLNNNYGYKTINTDLIPQHSSSVLDSQKQIVINPLFMAVSSFVGMALLFMFSVIMLPRIFGEFKSRLVHDEFLDLTNTVTEAVDNYNLTVGKPYKEYAEAMVGIRTRPGYRVKRKKYRRGRNNDTSVEGSI